MKFKDKIQDDNEIINKKLKYCKDFIILSLVDQNYFSNNMH
jgi:hypothetical protein